MTQPPQKKACPRCHRKVPMEGLDGYEAHLRFCQGPQLYPTVEEERQLRELLKKYGR